VKLAEAEEKVITLTQELDTLKSDLKSSSEKISLVTIFKILFSSSLTPLENKPKCFSVQV
jgi:hypothetical protein